MKIKRLFITNVIVVVAALSYGMVGSVGAQQGSVREPTASTAVTATDVVVPAARLSIDSTLLQRKEQRKADLQIKIDTAKADRIANKCQNAQDRIQNAINHVDEVKANRVEKYDLVMAKLGNVIDRLKAANVDTTTLESQVADLDAKIQTFVDNVDAYRLALNDAASIDCVTDPEGFVLALEDARALKTSLRQEGDSIKQFIKDNIVVTLQSIKDSFDNNSGV